MTIQEFFQHNPRYGCSDWTDALDYLVRAVEPKQWPDVDIDDEKEFLTSDYIDRKYKALTEKEQETAWRRVWKLADDVKDGKVTTGKQVEDRLHQIRNYLDGYDEEKIPSLLPHFYAAPSHNPQTNRPTPVPTAYDDVRAKVCKLAGACHRFPSLERSAERHLKHFLEYTPAKSFTVLTPEEGAVVCWSLVVLRYEVLARRVKTGEDLSERLDDISFYINTSGMEHLSLHTLPSHNTHASRPTPVPTAYSNVRAEVQKLARIGLKIPGLQHTVKDATQHFLAFTTASSFRALTPEERAVVCWSLVVLQDHVLAKRVKTGEELSKSLEEVAFYINMSGMQNHPFHPRAMLSLRQQHNYGQTHARSGSAFA